MCTSLKTKTKTEKKLPCANRKRKQTKQTREKWENPKNYTTPQKQSQTLSPTEIVKYENMKTETEIYMNIYLDNYYIYIYASKYMNIYIHILYTCVQIIQNTSEITKVSIYIQYIYIFSNNYNERQIGYVVQWQREIWSIKRNILIPNK